MKPLIRSGLVSLFTGLLFVAGAGFGLALLHYTPWPQDAPPPSLETSTYKAAPADLVIVEHERIVESPDFLVHGTLVNNGTGTWYAPVIHATVLAGGAQMNSCSVHLDQWFMPGDKHPFTILCRGTAGGQLPDNVTYVLDVRSAHGP